MDDGGNWYWRQLDVKKRIKKCFDHCNDNISLNIFSQIRADTCVTKFYTNKNLQTKVNYTIGIIMAFFTTDHGSIYQIK